MPEIRFHGRGGQGIKIMAQILADAFIKQGKHAQAFPEFGPERRGAPVKSFVRVSDETIKTHEPVTSPSIVVVLDDSLMEMPEIYQGLGEKGVLIVNTSKKASAFREKTRASVHTIDATSIALEIFGKNIVNTSMLGALTKVAEWEKSGFLELKLLKWELKEYFKNKKDIKVAEKNLQAFETAAKKMKND